MEKEFIASKDQLPNVMEYLEDELTSHGCSMKAMMQLQIAVEELFVNVASYAYPDDQGVCILGMDFQENFVDIWIKDLGIPFNPMEKEDPDITLEAKDRDIGGLGIYMVKRYVDSCGYQYEEKANIFTMRKVIK